MPEALTGSWALRALILIALDSHQHHWCTLDWLARRLELTPLRVKSVADDLCEHGMIDRCDDGGAGHVMYGVKVELGQEIVQ
ncbi:MAG: hypothetical protein KIT60_06870 [Burkholderiaceae bacterium]|nr:hypothetical protein [Burkholderiaceae bacterium]